MSEVTCFLVEDTGRDRLFLCRFVYGKEGDACSHDASVPIGETSTVDAIESSEKPPAGYENDTRWPSRCEACGYEFQPADQWQLFRESIYKRPDTGEEFDFRSLPAGAMYNAKWFKDINHNSGVGPDGIALHVVCPPGESWGDHWHVDGPASNGSGWQRTGTIPNVTVTPSILTPRYHGHLRNGILVSC